jgi:hypothetical protein
MEMVEDLKADGEGHLQIERRNSVLSGGEKEEKEEKTNVNDTHNDGHLHLERVGKDEDVVGSVPSRVNTEEVPRSGLNRLDGSVVVRRPAPLGGTEVEREGEDVVVDETGVNGEELPETGGKE